MTMHAMIQYISALSSIAMILIGSDYLKKYLYSLL